MKHFNFKKGQKEIKASAARWLPHKFELKENSNQGKETQNPFGEASDFTV